MNSSIEGKIGDALFEIYESVRNNEKTLEQLEWFNGMTQKRLNTLINNPAKYFVDELKSVIDKFELYLDVGEITIPRDYERGEYYQNISDFDREKLYFEGKRISKKNIPWPSSSLRKGMHINVRFYKQKTGTKTTSDERMLFLVAKDSMFLGMQGLSFLAEYKRDEFEVGYEYSSYEIFNNSLRDMNNRRLVTSISLNDIDDEDGDIVSYLPFGETKWDESNILVCFSQDF